MSLDDDWKTTGACAGRDDFEMWHSDDPGFKRQAVLICQHCPVQARCAETAIQSGSEWGVWGGLLFAGTARPFRVLDVFARPEKDCAECSNRFIPAHGLQRYCSPLCQRDANNRSKSGSRARRRRLAVAS